MFDDRTLMVDDSCTESRFYDSGLRSSPVMNLAHLPGDLLPLLQMDVLATYESALTFECTSVVELGCFDGRALESAKLAGVPYVGVDLDPGGISLLRRRIFQEGLEGMATGHVGHLQDIDWDADPIGDRPLFVFPFNLLGTFRRPSEVLRTLPAGSVVLTTLFNDTEGVTALRLRYYSRCEVRGLTAEPDDDGVLFTGSDAFHSRGFTAVGVHCLAAESGMAVIRMRSNATGYSATLARHEDLGTATGSVRYLDATA